MNMSDAVGIFSPAMDYTPFCVRNVRGKWLARYSDMGLKSRLAKKPFVMWAAIRDGEVRAGFETRREAYEWAGGGEKAVGFNSEVVERIRKALKDDVAGNAKCTMTDLDLACEMLSELATIKRRKV